MAREAGIWALGIGSAILFWVSLDVYALLPESEAFFDRRFFAGLIAWVVIRGLARVEFQLESK